MSEKPSHLPSIVDDHRENFGGKSITELNKKVLEVAGRMAPTLPILELHKNLMI